MGFHVHVLELFWSLLEFSEIAVTSAGVINENSQIITITKMDHVFPIMLSK